MLKHTVIGVAVLSSVVGGLAASSRADMVTIGSSRDNTLYSENANSNGAGVATFAGKNGTGAIRRGLLFFDVAANIPAGSTILSARVRLNNNAANVTDAVVRLNRVLESWGEGTSNGGPAGGSGAPATAGDATWVNRFHPGTPWSTAGGTFDGIASASTTVGAAGTYDWSSGALAGDVSLFLNTPSSNQGWILLGDESVNSSAKRFATREEPTAALRPMLLVEYMVPNPGGSTIALASLAMLGVRRRRK